MKAVVIYAHPNPMSFNSAIAVVVKEELEKKGAEVKFKDLYAMNWNPVLSSRDFEGYHTGNLPEDIKTEQADISGADVLVMVAPVWWYSIPAILKGYIDRVLSIGFAYKYTPTGPRGMLTGKKALLVTTSGADESTAQQGGMVEGINETVVNSVFSFSGFAQYKYKNFFAVPTVSDQDRKEMLAELRQLIQNYV